MARTEQARRADMDPHASRRYDHQKPSPGQMSSGQMSSGQQPVMSLPPVNQTQTHSRADGARVKVHSYNSFKKIIEGKTFHPEDYSSSRSSHSRESSQASNTNDHKTSPEWPSPPEEQRLSIENRHQHERGSYNRHGLTSDYELKHAHRVRLRTESDLSPTNVYMSPESRKQYSPRTHIDEFNNYDLTTDQDYLQKRLRSSGSPSAQTLTHLPQVHRASNYRRDEPHMFQFNPERMLKYERTEPEGKESLQTIPSVSEQYQSILQTKHVPERLPVNRPVINEKRAKLRRQAGVHVKDDVPMFLDSRQRPKSDFIIRPNREELKTRRGQGHVNSAFVEDKGDTEFRYLRDPGKQREIQSVRPVLNGPKYPSEAPPKSKDFIKPGGKVGSDNSFYKNHLRKTVNEARRERDELVEMRRHYVRQKHYPSYNNANIQARGLQSPPNTSEFSRRIENQCFSLENEMCDPLDIQINKEHKISQSKPRRANRKTQHRLSKTPRESGILTLENNNYQSNDPEIGLKKYVKAEDSDRPIGGAIMVHKSPSGLSGDKQQDKPSSPAVINVGEMTWERIKSQISKKNTYEVQKESKESLKETPKPQFVLTKPRTHFTLSLFTLCFCLSPFGLFAMIFAVCSASAFKDKDIPRGKILSKVAFVLSVIGIITTVATAAVLIGTNTIPVLGRYEEPEGLN